MALSDIKTIEWLLINWGRWAYYNRGLSLYYQSIEPYERLRRTKPPSPAITDDEAYAVDLVISEMKRRRPAQHEALVLHYLAGYPYRAIAKEKKTNHRQIHDLVTGGKLWLEGALTGGAPFTDD